MLMSSHPGVLVCLQTLSEFVKCYSPDLTVCVCVRNRIVRGIIAIVTHSISIHERSDCEVVVKSTERF